MSKMVAKTIRFRAYGVMEEFIDMQRNFSGAVRYLILEYIARQKEAGLPIEDLSSKLEEVAVTSMVDKIMEGRGRSKEEPVLPVKENGSVKDNGKISEPMNFAAGIENTQCIPDCYT